MAGYSRPAEPGEALRALAADPAARWLAGGTELVPWLRDGLVAPAPVVDLSGLPLAEIRSERGGLRIGALARLAEVAAHPDVQSLAPVLARAIERSASPQLRHMATLGGNLLQRTRCPYFRAGPGTPCNKRAPGSGCPARAGDHRQGAILGAGPACVATHPSDPAVALAALDAGVLVESVRGRRQLTLDQLLPLPGSTPDQDRGLERDELMTAIVVPHGPAAARSAYHKVQDRAGFDFAVVSAAVSVAIEAGRPTHVAVALGGVAPRPWRCRVAEPLLTGAPVDADRVRRAFAAELAQASPLPGNAFKVALAIDTATAAVLDACGEAP